MNLTKLPMSTRTLRLFLLRQPEHFLHCHITTQGMLA